MIRLFDAMFGKRSVLWFLFWYIFIFIVLILIFDGLIDFGLGPDIESQKAILISNFFDDANRVFLAVQVAMIGVIFPISIALITLLLQRGGQTSSGARIDAFLWESRSFEIGASGISLSLVILSFHFFPFRSLSTILFNYTFSNLALSFVIVINGFWVTINIIALWNFIYVGFLFINPRTQQHIMRRFVINVSIPSELEDRLTSNYFAHPWHFGLMPSHTDPSDNWSTNNPSISFGSGLADTGVVTVQTDRTREKVLHDVYFSPLRWLALRWWEGAKNGIDDSPAVRAGSRPLFVVPMVIGRIYQGRIILCRQQGGPAFKFWEKKIFKRCFVYRNTEF